MEESEMRASMPGITEEKVSPLTGQRETIITRDFKAGMIGGLMSGTVGALSIGLALGTWSEQDRTVDRLRPSCEVIGSMDTPDESLNDGMKSMRALCAKYGFIQ